MNYLILIKILQHCIDDLSPPISEEQLWEKNIIKDEKTFITKYDICNTLNISSFEFNKRIYDNTFPKGRKRFGKRELFWIKEDLTKIDKRIKNCPEYYKDVYTKILTIMANNDNRISIKRNKSG